MGGKEREKTMREWSEGAGLAVLASPVTERIKRAKQPFHGSPLLGRTGALCIVAWEAGEEDIMLVMSSEGEGAPLAGHLLKI